MSVPTRPAPAPMRPADGPVAAVPELAEARATTHRVARTFALACRLLPRAVRDDVYLLYLVFRTLDDLVDERRPEAADRVEAVAAWAEGRPGARTREVAALEALAARHPVPPRAMADFCAGMRHDIERATFATEAEVDLYCYRVAGTVGLMMAAILGMRDRARAEPAAAALGMAMQRTNILRDLDEDAAAGSSYVAQETIGRLGAPVPGLREALVRDQIARAEELFEQGMAGIPELRQGRRAIAAAAAMYREILREIERGGYGAVPGRAVVRGRRKLAVGLRAALSA